MRIITLIFIVLASAFSFAKGAFEMPAIFSDNMVLQRNSEAPFWGKGVPGEKVAVTASWGANASAEVKSDSSWLCKIKTPDAGGPYEITVKVGSGEVKFKNVLIGEVWICSGQSNMEMPVKGWPPADTIFNSAKEIENANYPDIHLFTVTRSFSPVKEFNCTGSWAECSPQTAADFSATAYFFGKKLYEELKVPIGLIHTSWGGTPVQAWTDAKYLEETPYYKGLTKEMSELAKNVNAYTAWLKTHPTVDISGKPSDTKWEGLDLMDKAYAGASYDDSGWLTMELPGFIENNGFGNLDGAVWFRKTVNVPDSWKGKELVVELGAIDDMDATYVNGQKVGSYEKDGFWNFDRVYSLPADLTGSGKLVIAVRMIDGQGAGGFSGPAEKLNVHPAGSSEKVSIAGEWKFLPAAELKNGVFYIYNKGMSDIKARPELKFESGPNAPSMLYNAMINPLVPYSMRGAIWYQGEANVSEPEKYKELFSQMIKNWRADWKQEFPFLFVQIAPYTYGGDNSAYLREAQFKTMTSVPKVGMAVTMDIGSAATIHPGNKQDVGKRLALWALAKTYGKDAAFSGPVYEGYKIKDGKIVLEFEQAEGLTVKPVNGNNFFTIAGADKVFKPAQVEAKGNTIVVSSPEVKEPKYVRYSFENTSESSVFNAAGLPSSSFRTSEDDK